MFKYNEKIAIQNFHDIFNYLMVQRGVMRFTAGQSNGDDLS